MIQNTTIQAVRDLPIADVIGKYVELKKKGGNYLGKSPFSDEHTPSFTVFPRNNNYKDFSSGKQGDGISFVMEFCHLEFYEAIREIANNHNIIIQDEELTTTQKEERKKQYDERKELMTVMEWAKNHFMNNTVPESWLDDRKFDRDLAGTFQLGYGTNSLHDEAKTAGINVDLLIRAGLVREYEDRHGEAGTMIRTDAYTDRVIFPILDTKGQCIAFTARYNGEKKDAPKYINSPGEIWDKGKNLYGIYHAQEAIRKERKVYLVEGPTDVMAMYSNGLTNTVCPCGTALTDDQCKMLYRYTDEVTIVPDNDLEKPGNPGLKALQRNALKLLQNGFIVRVLIPGSITDIKNTDPDSWLRTMKTDDQLNKWLENEEGFLDKYLLRLCLTMDEGTPEDKYAAVKLMAENLEAVKETGYRNSIHALICQSYKFFKKEYKLEAREKSTPTTSEIESLKREVREEYFKDKFIEEDGRYVAWEKGKKSDLSNFTFKVIFSVTFVIAGEPYRKAVLSLTDVFNYHTLAVVDIDDFCTATIFKKTIRRRGDYLWSGKDTNLDDIYAKNFLNAPFAIELDRMGWNTYFDFWVWSNGIYYNNQFHPMDKYGLIQRNMQITSIEQLKKVRDGNQFIIEGKLIKVSRINEFISNTGDGELMRLIDAKRISKVDFFYLPFGSALQIETGDDDKGIDFKKDIKLVIPEPGKEWTFDMWAAKINELYGKNGWMMIAYYLGSLFRDYIHKYNHGWYPLLYFFGRPRSGKSTAAKSLYFMFGSPPQSEGVNLSSGSTETGMIRYMNTITNIPGLFNEYKNHVRDKIKEVMKGWVDGSGKLQGTKSSKGTEALLPKSGALICGQELPSSEAALMDRIIPLEFREENRPDKKIFDEFKIIEESGIFTWITCKLIEYRPLLKHYKDVDNKVHNSIYEKSLGQSLKGNDRLFKNACSILSPVKLFMEHTDLKFPFTYEQIENHMLDVMRTMTTIQAESDEVDIFFRVLMSLVGTTNGINEGNEFMIKNTGDKKLLYLRFRACWGKYAERAQKESINPMPESSLKSYLKTHRSYIDETRQARFPSIPKTSAYVFDYDYLLENDIILQASKKVTDEEMRLYEGEKLHAFEKLIKDMELDTPASSKDLIAKLSHMISDHITKSEFVEMCKTYNQKKNGRQIQKHDDEATIIYVEKTGQTDLAF